MAQVLIALPKASSSIYRLSEVETRLEVVINSDGPGACAGPAGVDDETILGKVERLEGWVNSIYEWTETKDTRNGERLDKLE